MTTILDVFAREILDSRGNPTLEVDVILESGTLGRAAVPSGASTGEHEAVELRDGDKSRYLGKGVLTARDNVNDILAPNIVGMDAADQIELDNTLIELDGTENKAQIGANAIMGVSVAAAKAAAEDLACRSIQYLGGVGARLLPVPMMNIMNGGKHADNNVDIQEFMIMPVGAPSFAEALQDGGRGLSQPQVRPDRRNSPPPSGTRAVLPPTSRSNREALDLIMTAIEKAGYKPGEDVLLALDCAASSFLQGRQVHACRRGRTPRWTLAKLTDFYETVIKDYPIISIEDGHGRKRLGRLSSR